MGFIRFPEGAIQTLTGTMAATPVLSGTVSGPCILTLSTEAFDTALTVNLGTLGTGLLAGDLLLIKWLNDGTGRVMTCGTGFTTVQPTSTGIASCWTNVLCMFNGSTFDRIGSLAA